MKLEHEKLEIDFDTDCDCDFDPEETNTQKRDSGFDSYHKAYPKSDARHMTAGVGERCGRYIWTGLRCVLKT